MTTPETALTQLLTRLVHTAGGSVIRLLPALTGLPDLLILYPAALQDGSAAMWFVELKSDKGRLSPAQEACLQQLANLNARVAVLQGVDEVEQWAARRAVDPAGYGK